MLKKGHCSPQCYAYLHPPSRKSIELKGAQVSTGLSSKQYMIKYLPIILKTFSDLVVPISEIRCHFACFRYGTSRLTFEKSPLCKKKFTSLFTFENTVSFKPDFQMGNTFEVFFLALMSDFLIRRHIMNTPRYTLLDQADYVSTKQAKERKEMSVSISTVEQVAKDSIYQMLDLVVYL